MELNQFASQPQPIARSQDRVRANTPSRWNHRIDQATMKRICKFASAAKEDISRRIEDLDHEWDIERILETNAAALSLTGLALGLTADRKWLLLPAAVLSFLLQHSVTRKSLPVHLLRRAGVRTRREIDAEKYALKMLRGDFDSLKHISANSHKAIEALRVIRLN